MASSEQEGESYVVLVNNEGQYSIWLDEREIPDGWNNVGLRGTKGECIAFVDENWRDLRPASIRN